MSHRFSDAGLRYWWPIGSTIVLIAVIPLLIAWIILSATDRFHEAFDAQAQKAAVELADAWRPTVLALLDRPEELEQTLAAAVDPTSDVHGLEVRVSDGQEFRVLASTDAGRRGLREKRTQDVLAMAQGRSIAFQARQAPLRAASPEGSEEGRYWNVVAPLGGKDQPIRALLHVQYSMRTSDAVTRDALAWTWWWIVVVIAIVLAFLAVNVRLFRWLHEANARLRSLDEVKTTFIDVVGHQLRTPLTSIRWSVESLLSGESGSLTRSQQQTLREMHQRSDFIYHVTHDLLAALDIEKQALRLTPEPIQLAKMVRPIVTDMRGLAVVRRVSVDVAIGLTIAVFADPALCRDLFTKVIQNAILYAGDGRKVRIAATRKKSSVIVTVSDNGIGIPKAEQSRIFTRFYRASNAAVAYPDGIGLSLHLVKSYVEAQGGSIWFRSREGEGTTFFIQLPVASA